MFEVIYLKRSDTDLGNTQSAPRGRERATGCYTITAVGGGVIGMYIRRAFQSGPAEAR